MDPQQELFSAVLMALKEKYEDTGVGVYDTDLPPEDTPYPLFTWRIAPRVIRLQKTRLSARLI